MSNGYDWEAPSGEEECSLDYDEYSQISENNDDMMDYAMQGCGV